MMPNQYEFTTEDFFADNEASVALMEATCDLLKKLRREGLEDCLEFDKGVTALRHWYQRKKYSIEKLERLVNEWDDLTDNADTPAGE